MVKGKRRQQTLLVIVIGLACVWLADRVLGVGLRTRRTTLRQHIASEEIALRTALVTQQRKEAIRTAYQQYAPYFAEGLTDRELMAEFLKETERIAQDSGVLIVNLSSDNVPSTGRDSTTYKAQLKVEASVQQLVNLLEKIQNSRLLITLDSFSLSPKDKEASSLTLEATIMLSVP